MPKVLYINPGVRHYRIPTYLRLASLVGKAGYAFTVYASANATQTAEKKLMAELGLNVVYSTSGDPLFTQERLGKNNYTIVFNWALLRYLFKERPAIIIQEGFAGWGLLSWLAKLFWRAKVVVSYERTHHTERANSWLKRRYHRLAAKYLANQFCVNGSRCEAYVLSLGVAPEKIQQGSMACWTPRLSRFTANESDTALPEAVANENRLHLVFVGALIPRKGVSHLVDIVNAVAHKLTADESVQLQVIGQGPLEPLLEHIDNRVVLQRLGQLPAEAITHRYSQADMLLLPTLEDNWSLVVPEAMTRGCIPATTAFNGVVPDLVDASTGLVIDVDNVTGSADSIVELWRDRKMLAATKRAARQRIQHYNSLRAARVIASAVFRTQLET